MTVHYGRDYDNAFWNGAQLVFGDGDGEVFDRFTKPVDVLGHELTHAVTEHTAGLVYQDQSGALNESVSDVFARLPQAAAARPDRRRGRLADRRGLFLPGVAGAGAARHGRARARPTTTRRSAATRRPAHMDDYVDTTDDNGGVHLNSGIPNRAFHLAATAIGGSSWEGAGRIWYAALTGGDVGADDRLRRVRRGHRRRGGRARRRGRARPGRRWASPRRPASAAARASRRPGSGRRRAGCEVRRSGGFAGPDRRRRASTSTGDDPRAAEVATLVDRVDLSRGGRRRAPRRTCTSTASTSAATAATVPEQHLTADLRRLAELVLDDSATRRDSPDLGAIGGRCRTSGLSAARSPRARSSAASTCSVVHGKTGRSTSAWWMSSSISVQPSSTPSAPASQSSSMSSTTRRRVRVDDVAVHQLVVDRGVEPVVVLRGRGTSTSSAVAGHPVGEEAVGHRDRGADEADRRSRPAARQASATTSARCSSGMSTAACDLVGDLVERRRAQQQEVGARPLDAARRPRPAARRSGPSARRPRGR